MTPGYRLAGFARLLLGLLERSGVQHLVVSPGSRSTPYLLAAQRHSQLRIHCVIDERSAAYVALGLCRGTSQPVALLCTSGTAAANYLPALVEANLTGCPLVVLTADRPIGLQDCAASQTIDQTRLYGSHVVASYSLTPPLGEKNELFALRRLVLSGIAQATTGTRPGPIHFNLHSDKPLEIVVPQTLEDQQYAAQIDEVLAFTQPFPNPPRRIPDQASIERIAQAIEREPRGLITCGFDPELPKLRPDVLLEFAKATGYPVLLDASHPLRLSSPVELRPYLLSPFEPWLRQSQLRMTLAPEVIVQLGRPLTSSVWEEWLQSVEEKNLLIVARHGWPDPSGRGALCAVADPSEALTALSSRLSKGVPRSTEWLKQCAKVTDCARSAIRQFFAQCSESESPANELGAVFSALKSLPDESRLVIGNSLAIRHVDLLGSEDCLATADTRVHLEALRGASGIDGVTSVAAGLSLSDNRPTTLLLGDISFLHDVGGLYAAQCCQGSLAILVLNNGGGRIFEQLAVNSVATETELIHWTTPQDQNLAHAAALYGLRYFKADTRLDLVKAIQSAHAQAGATVIEIICAPTSARTATAALVAEVSTELARQEVVPTAQVRGATTP